MAQIIPGIMMANTNTVPQLTEPATAMRGISITPQAIQQPAPVNATDIFNSYLNQFQGNPDVTNTLQTAFNGLNQFTDTAKGVNDLYDYMISKTSPAFNDFQRINQQLGQENAGLLQNQLNQAYQWFGPQGEQTQRVNQYYADLANNIAAQNAANLGEIDAQAKASGASAGAARNARAKATTTANTDLLNANAKQFEMYDNIYKNLGTYIDNYTKSMANNKNQYVRDVYDRLLQYSQGVEQARANAFQNLRSLQLEDALRKQAAAGTGTRGLNPTVKIGTDVYGNYIATNADGSMYAMTPEQIKMSERTNPLGGIINGAKAAMAKNTVSNNKNTSTTYSTPK